MSEFQIVLNVSMEETQKKLDKALKRNLNNNQQVQSVTSAQKNPATSELPTEETINDSEEPEQIDE